MGVERSFDPDVVVAYVHGRNSLNAVRQLLPIADHESENRETKRGEIEDLKGIVVLPGAVKLLTRLPPSLGPSRPPASIDWRKSAACRRATNSSMDGYLNRGGSWRTRS